MEIFLSPIGGWNCCVKDKPTSYTPETHSLHIPLAHFMQVPEQGFIHRENSFLPPMKALLAETELCMTYTEIDCQASFYSPFSAAELSCQII